MERDDGGEGEGGGAAADAGEDRLSALPDDPLVLILGKLTTPEAARTSVLSRRWRRIWKHLPELWFSECPEPHRLRDVLDDHKVLLDDLMVRADGATPEFLAVWLPTAARRVSGHLALDTYLWVEDAEEDYDSEAEQEEAARRGAFEFPCFEKATGITFFMCFQGLAVPVTGVFARLAELDLCRVWFHGPGELGDAVSSPRCPCLQTLTIKDARGLRDLAIHSKSLQRLKFEGARGLRDLAIHSESMLSMELRDLRILYRLTVVAPALKELTIKSCFLQSEPVANISAPLLTKLDWVDEFDSSSVHLGKMAHLHCLGVRDYLVYGEMFMDNEPCFRLLQRFKGIKSLSLPLLYPRDIENYDYMMEGMAVLPNITFLFLMVRANGHAFGASAFHVLRLCTGIRSLKLDVAATVSEAQTVCTSDCKCLQLIQWETEELLLNHLEEVEIYGWRGTEHEIAFVKRLFECRTKLKEMRVKFRYFPTSEVNAKDLYQTFQSFSRPGVCVKFYRYGLPYAPKD